MLLLKLYRKEYSILLKSPDIFIALFEEKKEVVLKKDTENIMVSRIEEKTNIDLL